MKHARVLVVDDEEDIRQALSDALKQEGHEVETAENGKVAVRLLREHSVDIVLTDILMPGMDGIESITYLRREFPQIVVIAMSGQGHDYLPAARHLGATYALAKPFDVEELLKVIAGHNQGG